MGLELWKMSLAAGVLVLSASQASALSDIYANGFYLDEGDYSKVSSTSGTRYDPNSALGNTTDFFSLGLGGLMALSFGENFRETAVVIEKTNGCTTSNEGGECSNYTGETANVYAVSSKIDIENYKTNTSLSLGAVSDKYNYDLSSLIGSSSTQFLRSLPNGEAQNGFTIDLSGAMTKLGSLGYLLIEDTSLVQQGRDGFDLVSVKVQPVPVPAALPLFGLVAAGFGFAGWHKRKMA